MRRQQRTRRSWGLWVFTFCSLMRWSNFCREIYMIRILVQLKDGIRKRCTDLDSPPISRLLFGILSRRLALLPAFD